jgi:hypothetical protein
MLNIFNINNLVFPKKKAVPGGVPPRSSPKTAEKPASKSSGLMF